MKLKNPSPEDMWVLLLDTVRYSMGRMTYMSSLAPELVIKYNDYLSLWQLKQIKEEVENEIAWHVKDEETENFKKTGIGRLGHHHDYLNWDTFVFQLGKIIEEREKEEDGKGK